MSQQEPNRKIGEVKEPKDLRGTTVMVERWISVWCE
jgi:hypothetical protein